MKKSKILKRVSLMWSSARTLRKFCWRMLCISPICRQFPAIERSLSSVQQQLSIRPIFSLYESEMQALEAILHQAINASGQDAKVFFDRYKHHMAMYKIRAHGPHAWIAVYSHFVSKMLEKPAEKLRLIVEEMRL